MSMPPDLLDCMLSEPSKDVWTAVLNQVLKVCSEPIAEDVTRTIRDREGAVGEIDDLISSAAWELWHDFRLSVPGTADALAEFWARPHGGKAILILDGLSLRELPHLLQGAPEHGLAVRSFKATASELPPDTDPFATALSFPSRSALRNNPSSARFPGANTMVSDMDWGSVAASLPPQAGLIVWHQYADDRVHALENDGDAFGRLSREHQSTFRGEDFWSLVKTLATGRTVIVTSDHGYGVSSSFTEMPDGPTQFLRDTFKARRSLSGEGDLGSGSPPLALRLDTPRGPHRIALGRRKWKVPGGFPKLTHGGLTLFETLCPFVEIENQA